MREYAFVCMCEDTHLQVHTQQGVYVPVQQTLVCIQTCLCILTYTCEMHTHTHNSVIILFIDLFPTLTHPETCTYTHH